MDHGSVDVKTSLDGFVPGDLGDETVCGVGEAPKILHSDWLETKPVCSAGSSDLPNFPGMSEACGVPGLLRPTGDGIISEGCCDADVQCEVLTTRSEGNEQVRWSSD